jgi:phosphate acetyltransferase
LLFVEHHLPGRKRYMAQNLYVTGAEHESGKSVIVLAIMELLSGRSDKAGLFRPVVRTTPEQDMLLNLVTKRYKPDLPLEAMYGCTLDTAQELGGAGRYAELIKIILAKYKALDERCEHVLCAGTDYAGAGNTLEFDFNADIANNLGCLLIPVVRGKDRNAEDVVNAVTAFIHSLEERDCQIAATIVNRVAPEFIEEVKSEVLGRRPAEAPVYVVAEEPTLSNPTIDDIAQVLGARQFYADAGGLNREVQNFKVAAMELPGFLEHIEDGSLVLTPGDRSDIILGSIASYTSAAYPPIAGLVLTGGLEPAPQVRQLMEGLGRPPVPILGVDMDTFTTAMQVASVHGVLTPENERKIAAALGAVERGVDLAALQQRLTDIRSTRVTPLMFEHELIQRAKSKCMHIVLPEGTEERILRAAEILHLRGAVELTLLGDGDKVLNRINELGLRLEGINIVSPLQSALRESFANTYYELRKHKGISREMAFDAMADVSYFGTMMVRHGLVDGMVSGSVHTTQHTVRPAFEIIRARPDSVIVSSVFLMCLEDRVLVYGDCAINPDPDAEQLADIAISSARTAQMFDIEPRVAMLSYSTGTSGKGTAVDKVAEATAIVRRLRPDLMIEGPIQYDAAVDASVAHSKLPDSEVAGHATVFVFPDLNTGNNTYKAVQRSAGAVAIGPILQGLNKPVNDLSRGCTVADIVNTVAITAIQAQAGEESG